MDLLPVLREMLDHNYWARDRQLQTCAVLSEEEFLRSVGGSFPSVRDALAHLAGVEWLWLERWRGRAPRAVPGPDQYPTLAAISELWRTVERDMRDYLAGLTEETVAEAMTYVNMRGQEWSYSRWRMFLHLMNHQSFHRGQVTAMLRVLGHAPPPVDFLVAHDMGFRLG